jgi:PAS domain S-box-containing protein
MQKTPMNNDVDTYSTIELDSLSSTILNALNAQIAIIDPSGMVVAYNEQWKLFMDELQESWSRPSLNTNLLQSLQAPLTAGNDFALRLLLGLKDVLGNETSTFETKQQVKLQDRNKWFHVKVKSLGAEHGAVLIYEDISFQTQSREYLKETRLKFEKHFNNTFYGILVSNQDNKIIEANNAACSLLGICHKDLISSDITRFIQENTNASVLQKRINRNGNIIGERELITKNGNLLPIELSVTLFRNEHDETITSWAFKDISDERGSQKALEAQKKQYELHFNSTLEGIIIGHPDGRITEANPALCAMLGYEPGELEGKQRAYIFDEKKPANVKALKQRREDGKFTGEVILTRKDGTELYVEISSVIFITDAGTEKSIVTVRDLSQRKAYQQQLIVEKEFTEKAISSLPVAFFVFNLNGEMIRWNSILEKDLGYSHQEIGELSVKNLVHPKDHALLFSILNGELSGNTMGVEARCLTKNGETVHYLLRGTSFQQDGEHYIVGGGLNRSDFKQLQSEKAQVYKELKRTKIFNELAVNGANLGLWERVLNTDKSYFNDRWFKMLGYSEDEISSTYNFFLSLLHPDDIHIPDQELERYLKVQDGYEAEFRLRAKCGEYHWILSTAKFVEWDEHGNPKIIAGSHMDITERKKAELATKQSQKLLDQLFDNSPIGIVLVSTDGLVQNTNQSFQQLFGYTNEEIIGKDLNKTIVPNFMVKQGQEFSHISLTGDSFQSETTRLHKDGTEVPVFVAGVPVELDGEIIAIYGMYVNISERKHLENQIVELLETEKKARIHMQDMFEESPAAIAMLDGENHTYTFANGTYKNLVGEKDLLDKPVEQVLPELKDQGFIELLDNCYTSGNPMFFDEEKVSFKKGKNGAPVSHFLNFIFKPLRNENDEVYGIFVQAIDVTEQVEARNTIEKSLAEKETLLNEVHHRVKNNLAIISGLLELEIMGIEDKKVNKHLISTQSRIYTIAAIHELLYQNESLSHVSFNNYIETVIKNEANLPNSEGHKLISNYLLDEVVLNINQAIPMGMLLNEILDCLKDMNLSKKDRLESNLSMVMKDGTDEVLIELKDPTHSLLNYGQGVSEKNASLRRELVSVLLTQISGNMTIEEHPSFTSLCISFPKKEVKGPHSGL